MGYRAAKKEENTPVTMLSQVTLTLPLAVATSRVKVAVKAEDTVETDIGVCPSIEVKRSDIGTIPIRAQT